MVRERTPNGGPHHKMLGLERETRVELTTPAALRAVLCLGSTGWARHVSSLVDLLPPRQRVHSDAQRSGRMAVTVPCLRAGRLGLGDRMPGS